MIIEILKGLGAIVMMPLMLFAYLFLLFYVLPWVYKRVLLVCAVLSGKKELLNKLQEGDLCASQDKRTFADRFDELMGPPDNRYNHRYRGWRESGPIQVSWKPTEKKDDPPPKDAVYDFPAEWNDLL